MATDMTNEGDGHLLALPANADAAAMGRRFLNEHATGLPADVAHDAVLLVSELVTNAVRYGLPQISLRVRLTPPGLGVEIHDDGPPIPRIPSQQPDPTHPHGRGLLIVAALAHTWGIRPDTPPPGKTVWFELHP